MRNSQQSSRSSAWSQKPLLEKANGLDDLLLTVVDAGLAAVIFLTPLMFGGRHPLGLVVFVAFCCLSAMAWCLRQSISKEGLWTRNSATWLVIFAIGTTALQVVALPEEWLAAMSPRIHELLPLWSADAAKSLGLGSWKTISLAPFETKQAIAVLIAYALLFVTATQRLKTKEDIERVIKWIACSAVFAAAFGVLQYFASNGKHFWFYEYPYVSTSGEMVGSFTNRNHFAYFLVLGAGPLLFIALGSILQNSRIGAGSRDVELGRRKSFFVPLALSLLFLGLAASVMMSRSRGGCLALGATLATVAIVCLYFRIITFSTLVLLFAGGTVSLVITLSTYGFDRIAQRLDDFASGSVEELDTGGGRRKIWEANQAAIQSSWLTGSGAGSHRYVYPAYLKEPSSNVFTHAENSYLQIATENGLPGILVMLMLISSCATWCLGAMSSAQDRKTALLIGCVMASLVGSLTHAVVDFVWYVPACMATTVLLAACGLRLFQLRETSHEASRYAVPLPRAVWIGLSLLVVFSSGFALRELTPPALAASHWHKFQHANISHRNVLRQQAVYAFQQESASSSADQQHTRYMVGELQKVVSADADNAQAHLKLAVHLLRLFELESANSANRMTVAQIRDAAISSRFSSSQELRAWLLRAFGKQSDLLYAALHHTRQAIRLSPLQGEAYVYLAKLCYLEGYSQQAVESCLTQALVATPFDSDVLYAVGLHHLASNRVEEALRHWRPVFKNSKTIQFQVINILAGKLPAEILLQELQPTGQALSILWKYYSLGGSASDKEALEKYVAQNAVSSEQAGDSDSAFQLWKLLARIQMETERFELAKSSLIKAKRMKPEDFDARYQLAVAAMKVGDVELSEEQLRWCLSRRPDNEGLKKQLLEVSRLRLSGREKTVSLENRF